MVTGHAVAVKVRSFRQAEESLSCYSSIEDGRICAPRHNSMDRLDDMVGNY